MEQNVGAFCVLHALIIVCISNNWCEIEHNTLKDFSSQQPQISSMS